MFQVSQHVLLPRLVRQARLRVVYRRCGPKALPGNNMRLPPSLSSNIWLVAALYKQSLSVISSSYQSVTLRWEDKSRQLKFKLLCARP